MESASLVYIPSLILCCRIIQEKIRSKTHQIHGKELQMYAMEVESMESTAPINRSVVPGVQEHDIGASGRVQVHAYLGRTPKLHMPGSNDKQDVAGHFYVHHSGKGERGRRREGILRFQQWDCLRPSIRNIHLESSQCRVPRHAQWQSEPAW